MANALRAVLADSLPALSVGAISADLLNLGGDIARLESAGVRLLHFDVMDGQFVPMLSVGPAFVRACTTSMLKDVHLMVREPGAIVEDCGEAGADIVTIHPDSCAHPHAVLQKVGSLSNAHEPGRPLARGVALNPSTPLLALEPFLDEIDMVTLVAVNPGYAGQRFINATIGRVAGVREMLAGRDVLLCVDGGVTLENVGMIARLKPDIVVSGSAVFKGDVGKNVGKMTEALRR